MSQKCHGMTEVRQQHLVFWCMALNTIHRPRTVHPSFQFISHVPHSIVGEQLVNQFLRCIPDRTWLFNYGRVPLNLIMGEWVWQVSCWLHPSHAVFVPFVPLHVLSFSTFPTYLSIPSRFGSPFRSCSPNRLLVPPCRFNFHWTRTHYPCAHMGVCSWTAIPPGRGFWSHTVRVVAGPVGLRGEETSPMCSTFPNKPRASLQVSLLSDPRS